MIELVTAVILLCQVSTGNSRGYYHHWNKQYERNCQRHFIQCVMDNMGEVKKDKKVDYGNELAICIQDENNVGNY